MHSIMKLRKANACCKKESLSIEKDYRQHSVLGDGILLRDGSEHDSPQRKRLSNNFCWYVVYLILNCTRNMPRDDHLTRLTSIKRNQVPSLRPCDDHFAVAKVPKATLKAIADAAKAEAVIKWKKEKRFIFRPGDLNYSSCSEDEFMPP